MKNELFQDVRKVVDEAQLGTPQQIVPINSGIANGTYEVATDKGNYIVRKLSAYNPASRYATSSLSLRHAVGEYLATCGFPYETPRCETNAYGKKVFPVNGAFYEAYKKIEGDINWNLTDNQIREKAAALARYHAAVAGQDFGYRDLKTQSLENILGDFKSLKDRTVKNPVIDALQKDNIYLYERFAQDIEKNVSQVPQDSILLHGDFHSGNVVYKKNRLIGIIDFDNVSYGPRVFDIAYAAPSDGRYDNFIYAYHTENPLTEAERVIFPTIQAAMAIKRMNVFARMPAESDAQEKVFSYIVNKDKSLYNRLFNNQ